MCMWEKNPLRLRINSVALFLHPMHIATQKASIYKGCIVNVIILTNLVSVLLTLHTCFCYFFIVRCNAPINVMPHYPPPGHHRGKVGI